MLKHKSVHRSGLDTIIHHISKNLRFENDLYMYIWDYCIAKKDIPDMFFDISCNKTNTWNYNLEFSSTQKDIIMNTSINYGFGSYIPNYNKDNEFIIKAISHYYSSEKYGQCQLIKKEDISNIDKNKYIIQPILKNKDGEELNIFVFKNLKTNKYNLIGYIVTHNTNININRKQNKCTYKECNLEEYFGKKNIYNFLNYCRSIHLDYGRVELINDINRGWCIIDINNSPGVGPLTNLVYPIFYNILKKWSI